MATPSRSSSCPSPPSAGDRLGRRKVFISGLALFTLASAACALAPSTPALVAARAVQGLGGAAVLPLSLTILTAAFRCSAVA
jgi:MFS family permease